MLQKKIGILVPVFLIFILIFIFRVNQVGGLNQDLYRFSGGESTQNDFSLNIHKYLNSVFSETLPYPQSSLMSGIILGDKQTLPFTLKQELTTTSTIHIVVVSGENLSLLASFILVLAPFLGRKKTIGLILLSVVGFTFLTGFQIPVIRAAIMISLSYLAILLGKDRQTPWILFLSAAGMLLYNPNWLFSVSFQLSFLATAGVVLFSSKIINYLKFLPEIIRQDLGVTISAEALILPIVASNFHQISLLGILVNALVLWTILPVMLSGLAVLLVGSLNISLGALLAIIPNILLTYFLDIVHFFGNLPLAKITIGDYPVLLWIGYYFLLVAFLVLPDHQTVVEE